MIYLVDNHWRKPLDQTKQSIIEFLHDSLSSFSIINMFVLEIQLQLCVEKSYRQNISHSMIYLIITENLI